MSDGGSVDLRWGVKIPMRDGCLLNATVYTPRSQQGPLPAVVVLTPYISDGCHDRGVYFASRGLPFVVVDARGRGNSGGTFRPLIQEASDGYDVVEWLAQQFYCSGKVAMWGGSYNGYVQWATAKERPPHLVTIVPTAALYPGVDFPMRNNIFYPYVVQWLTLTAGCASQGKVFADMTFWSEIYRRWYESGRAFREVDALFGNPCAVFQEWLTHPQPDAYWDAHNPTDDQCAQLDIPILTITGSYDDDQPGALEHYRRHLRHASQSARGRHYLVVGPWDHAGTNTPSAQVGGLHFGPASLVDLPKLHLEWYAWTMQSGPKPQFLQDQVAYYVMGAERWRYADSLEAVTERHETYFLDSSGNANDVFASGSLGAKPGIGPADYYRFDPRDVNGPEVEAEAQVNAASLVDQSLVLALRGRQLIYHSQPFTQDTEISGFFRLSVWIAIDCPDADLYASVCEIGLEGNSIWLSADALRARYREGSRTQRLIQSEGPQHYDFERFTFVSRRLKRGHRLRLVIGPMGRLMEVTFAQKNYNGGGVVAEETAKDARPVSVRLFHEAGYPSALYVPLGVEEQCPS